jgi:archaellum biogenesis ATPase FlaH
MLADELILLKTDSVLLVKHPSQPDSLLVNTLKEFRSKKVCVISTTNGCDVILEAVSKHELDFGDFFVIDCVTKLVIGPKLCKECAFVSSPGALTEISIEFSKVLKNGFEVVIFDNISTVLVYRKPNEIERLLSHMINKIKASGLKLVIFVSEEDVNTAFFKRISMLADADVR